MPTDPPKIFLSYARQDKPIAKKLEQALRAHGYAVWRDQESIYGGQNWPKAIGEAVVANDVALLVWSKHASKSHFVEFEWSTAIALKKTIIPCLLDDTPLPPSLTTFNGLPMTDFDLFLQRILKSLQRPFPETDPQRREQVVSNLAKITDTEPEEIVREAKQVFEQQGWNVAGDVYQAGRDVIINLPESKAQAKKGWIETTQAKLTLVATVLGIIITIIALINVFDEANPSSRFQAMVVDRQSNTGIAGVRVKLSEVDGKQADETKTTTPDGRFVFKVAAEAGTKIRLSFDHPQYQPYNDYYETENAETIKLDRK